MKIKFMVVATLVVNVSACGGGTNVSPTSQDVSHFHVQLEPHGVIINGAAEQAGSASKMQDNRYQVVLANSVITLPVPNSTLNGQNAWNPLEKEVELRAYSFENQHVLAIGGVKDGIGFGGITGTLGNIPTAGEMSYAGKYALTNSIINTVTHGDIELNVNFGSGAITTVNPGYLNVTGSIAGDGTVAGSTSGVAGVGTLTGGFYGDDLTFAGTVVADHVGGVVFADKQ